MKIPTPLEKSTRPRNFSIHFKKIQNTLENLISF